MNDQPAEQKKSPAPALMLAFAPSAMVLAIITFFFVCAAMLSGI